MINCGRIIKKMNKEEVMVPLRNRLFGSSLLVIGSSLALGVIGCSSPEPDDPGAADLKLTVTVQGAEGGQVKINDIDPPCADSCEENFSSETAIELVATAGEGYMFSHYDTVVQCDGVDDTNETPTCNFTMDADTAVAAVFEVASSFELNVVVENGVGGQVAITPNDEVVTCSDSCSYDYPQNSDVTLTATPGEGYVFSSFGEGCSNEDADSSATCVVALDADKDVTVTFDLVNLASCLEALEADSVAETGLYMIDPDGPGGVDEIEVECDMETAGGGWQVIAADDFEADLEGSIAEGWSNGTITTCGTFGSILGGYNTFGNGAPSNKTFDLSGIAPHTEVYVSLDWIRVDTWDHENALINIDGINEYTQSMHYLEGTQVCGGSHANWFDASVPVELQLPHSADTLKIEVTSTLNEGLSNESFGIDNLRVLVR